MAGEKELEMDDWRVSDPSPRTLLASLMGGGDPSSKEYSVVAADDAGKVEVASPAREGGGTEQGKDGGDSFSESDFVSAPRPPSSRGSLAERMAARTGFNAPKLNTDCIRSASSPSPGIRSPYLTIPPGLSPTMFLDSPVFLSNSLTQQSPTTGKFPFGPFGDGCFLASSTAYEKGKDSSFTLASAPFTFRPPLESRSLDFSSVENKAFTASGTREQSLPSIEVSVQSAGQIPDINLSSTKNNDLEFGSQQNLQFSSSYKDIPALRIPQNVANSGGDSPPFFDQCDEDQKGDFSSAVAGAPAEDEYHWRKYGQKQVKGSEFPRSYYKCGNSNCPVKKKVERSLEGHITEIIYKGTHNHPKPLPIRRPGVGSTQTPAEGDNNGVTEQNLDGIDARWTAAQQSFTNGRADWMANGGMNKAAPGLISAEFYDPSLPMNVSGAMETTDARDVSSTMSNENDDDDRVTNGSVSVGCEEEEDDSESKRRKLDVCVSEISGATRAIREPRVVVQTTSEVDILDDGYRWRKYGQKVVKGNPNPRSYYKCTHPGCSVRKHVERASHDLKSVITTYEGKHNHDVPAAKNSSHHVTSAPPSAAPRPQQPQNHGNLRMFDQPAVLGSFNMPGRTQMPPIPNYTFGMGQPTLPNISMAGLGSAAYGKLPGLPLPHPYLGQQQQQSLGQPKEWAMVMPKGEPSEELPLESDLRMPNGSAGYHQLMNTMPLGPSL